MSEQLYISMDIEKAGAAYRYPITSLAFCVGNAQGEIMERRKWNVKVNWPDELTGTYGDFEPRCWEEFWSSKIPALKEACTENPDPADPQIVYREVVEFIDKIEKRANGNIVFVSDNPGYDQANIEYQVQTVLGTDWTMRCRPGNYYSMRDPFEMMFLLPKARRARIIAEVKKHVKHDHNCINDATFIYLTYVEVMKDHYSNPTFWLKVEKS